MKFNITSYSEDESKEKYMHTLTFANDENFNIEPFELPACVVACLVGKNIANEDYVGMTIEFPEFPESEEQ